MKEAVAWFTDRGCSGTPQCTCTVLAAYATRINIRAPDSHRPMLFNQIAPLVRSHAVGHKQLRAEYIIRRTAHEIIAPLFEARQPNRAEAIWEAQSMTEIKSACRAAANVAACEGLAKAAVRAAYAAHYCHYYATVGYGAFGIAAGAAHDAGHRAVESGHTVPAFHDVTMNILAGAIALGPNGGDSLAPFAKHIQEMRSR